MSFARIIIAAAKHERPYTLAHWLGRLQGVVETRHRWQHPATATLVPVTHPARGVIVGYEWEGNSIEFVWHGSAFVHVKSCTGRIAKYYETKQRVRLSLLWAAMRVEGL